MIFMTFIKLLVIAVVLLILRMLFPSLVRGFKRIVFIIIVSMMLFAIVVMYAT